MGKDRIQPENHITQVHLVYKREIPFLHTPWKLRAELRLCFNNITYAH